MRPEVLRKVLATLAAREAKTPPSQPVQTPRVILATPPAPMRYQCITN